jgi:hypothetical protein
MPASRGHSTTYMSVMENRQHHEEGKRPTESLAQALRALPDCLPCERTTVRDLLSALGERATPFILLVFSIPAIVPTPGVPAGAIFGTALAFLALQMMTGAGKLSLPRRIAMLEISRQRVASLVSKAAPTIEGLERFLRPRWTALARTDCFRPLGVIVFLMAVLVALPIPFGNMVPGLSVLAIALGLAQRDGVAVMVGLCLAVLACAISAGILMGSWWFVSWVGSIAG